MIHLYFAKDYCYLDFSEQSCIEMYNHETFGNPISPNNGFLQGKKLLNLTISMWKEDISKGYLFKSELYDDPNLPNHWLNKIFT